MAAITSSISSSEEEPDMDSEPGMDSEPEMDSWLLKAASCGDSWSMQAIASQDPSILLGTTPQGNTCLHISSIHGHEVFCMDVLALEVSLLSNVNFLQETPLVIAVTRGHASLASYLLGRCRELGLRRAILQQDRDGCNALYHAIQSGHNDLALELIAAEPALSQGVSKSNQSPMFVAVMRNWTHVLEKLLEIPDSAHTGQYGGNVLHAAVRNGNPDIATKIMEKRPWLARQGDMQANTPTGLAVIWDKIDMLRVLLAHDCSLGYTMNSKGHPLLINAASRDHVDVARELLNHCPDAPYCQLDGPRLTCLHMAIWEDCMEFVEFILRTPQLRNLVNMRDSRGKTALHYAVRKCNPKMVAALLSHKDIDTTVPDNLGWSAAWELWNNPCNYKTLNWNEVYMLMLKADPRDATSVYTLYKITSRKATYESRRDAKSLAQTYKADTSLVAILMATMTFVAAFTLPGRYGHDAGNTGLSIVSRKAFLISDALAMCSSFAVAFICIMARWQDYEFLIHYRSSTMKLMWFAYVATTTAFATGLYTVLASRLHWLAIGFCVLVALSSILTKLFLVALSSILTKLLGELPILKLIFRLGKAFRSGFLDTA